jgi:hypothetical protein
LLDATGIPEQAQKVETIPYSEVRQEVILNYVDSLPLLRRALLRTFKPERDSGVTSRVVSASYEYIDALQGILVALASFYPKGTFGEGDVHKFFSEQISSRFTWHWAHAEPYGPGTGGTIDKVIVSGNVIADVEKMVEDMTMSLVGYDDRFDWREWPKQWHEPPYM